jgi:hypothetical protein
MIDNEKYPLPKGKADLPLDVRRRIEGEDLREIKVAVHRRHFQVIEDEQAIHAARMDRQRRVLARAMNILARQKVIESVLPAEPEADDASAASAINDLRGKLGLG